MSQTDQMAALTACGVVRARDEPLPLLLVFLGGRATADGSLGYSAPLKA